MQDLTETAGPESADILHQRVMTLFCEALELNQAQPMDILESLASALGKVYREVADAHLEPDGCPCGWQPQSYLDVHELQFAFARAALSGALPATTLSHVIGHA